ncbi:cyanophycinase [Aquimarina sp. AU474]|uniref:cyanophycinase n=1 Tax=Aquimarina sp. AU474 TaxID=2108529 RepID=UPI000D69F6DC|nr:cyanophycinase [Aquimarina sp. AU474]
MNRFVFIFLFLALTLQSIHVKAQENNITQGYKNGTLILIGGGKAGKQIMGKFKELAGGDSAKIVVIPTAYVLNNEIDSLRLRASFEKHGFTNITILHTSDTAEANKDDFIKPIKEATGIFFTGGRQWRIADGFLNTKAHDEMFKLLDRGGVIAGSSAGATIQGSYLARGDSKNNQIMMGDHEVGLGFISNIAVDQHVIARNRQFDMFTILKNKPELLGIGIDESTAIVVKGDVFKVIGRSYVIIYDSSFWSREGSKLKKLPNKNAMFYYLRSGDRYNLRERKVIEE